MENVLLYAHIQESISLENNFQRLSDKQVNKILEGGPSVGYVWYNNNAEIEKIIFFGKTVIEH